MYTKIIKALGVSPKESNPSYNPKQWGTVERAKKKLSQFVKKDKVDEVISLAMIGEFSLLKLLSDSGEYDKH